MTLSVSWLSRNVGLPTGQNVLGGVAALALFTVWQGSWWAVTGCSTQALKIVEQGESLLGSGHILAASRFAEDARAISPNCIAVNELGAEVHRKLMVEALAERRFESAEAYRRVCYNRALDSQSVFGSSPQTLALLNDCSASSSGS